MRQCEYVSSYGQCAQPAIKGDRFCERHSARTPHQKAGAYLIANRLLGDPAERHAKSDEIKSVVGEIAVMRAMLELRLNAIENDAELIALGPCIKDTALAIDKMVNSLHTMEVKLGSVLSKQALMRLAQSLIEIITNTIRPFADRKVTTAEVDDAIEVIANAVVEAIAEQENTK